MGDWGETGPKFSWDALQGLVPHEYCKVVVLLVCVEPQNGSAMGVLYPNNINVRILGLPEIREATQSVTLVDAVFLGVNRIPSFKVTPHTLVVQHSPVRVASLYQVVELCAGIGIATTGLDFVGLTTKLAVELRAPFARVFEALHEGVKVITGDITDPQCLRQIVANAPGSCMIVAGFNCQPYSKLGTMRGVLDPRAESLHGVLQVAFYTRAPLVVLECVVEAKSNRHVQEELQVFCSQCGYNMSDVVLRLEDVWPCRRERWWVVLCAVALGKLSLKPLPVQQYPTMVKQILPRPLRMTRDDVDQLQIVEAELQRFVQFRPDLQGMMLSLQGKCPTLLHSLGSQASKCLCGCRAQGFSDSTLAKGLFGIVMPSDRPEYCVDSMAPRIRHPHPNEAAILSAIIPKKDWCCPHRLALAGIGQQANPIHALWIGAHIIAHLEVGMEGRATDNPRSVLDAYLDELLRWCKSAPLVNHDVPLRSLASAPDDGDVDMSDIPCPVPVAVAKQTSHPTCHEGSEDTCTVVHLGSSGVIAVSVDRQATVGDLILAESTLCGDGKLTEVIDPLSQHVLEASEPLHGRCLWVRWFDFVNEPLSDSGVEPSGEDLGISPTLPFEVVAPSEPSGLQSAAVDADGDTPMPCHAKAALGEGHASDGVGVGHLDPLLALSSQQLIELPRPTVTSLRSVDSLLAQTTTTELRLGILDIQGPAWSDDEIRWHMWQCMDKSTKHGVVTLEPLLASVAASVPSHVALADWFENMTCAKKIIISAVCIGGHWSPVVWTWTPECLFAHSWDLPSLIPNIKHLNEALAAAVGARTFSTRVLHRMDGSFQGCGVCTIRYIDHFLTGRMLPTTRDEIEYLSDVAKDLFRRHVQHALHIQRPWCWGHGLDQQAQARLMDLLKQHGVPSESLEQRSHLVVQAIGVAQLQKCLTGSAPWRSLKALANHCQPVLQLILPDELQAVLATKASTSSRKTKQRNQPHSRPAPAKPAPIDPSKLTFDSGAFVSDSGAPLPAIPVSQLGPLAEGVALAAIQDVQPFLRTGKVISQHCLAVFLLNVDEQQLQTDLIWAEARVALRCLANGEPMLLNGHLVQLGTKHVVQARTKHIVEVASLPAACMKVAIYRDTITCAWEDVVNAPIRYLLQSLEPLATCSHAADQCSCVKWHNDSKAGVRDPIFDLWRRQWLNLSMKAASPMQADVFLVNLRYAKQLELKLLALSGVSGIFLEPRTLDAREPVSDFLVLWMARQSIADLTHVRQCNPGVVGLARLGARLGLRIHAADMPTLGKTLKPEAIYLGGGPRMDFELGPVPFGLDRAGLNCGFGHCLACAVVLRTPIKCGEH